MSKRAHEYDHHIKVTKFIAAANGENWEDALDREAYEYEQSEDCAADQFEEMYGYDDQDVRWD